MLSRPGRLAAGAERALEGLDGARHASDPLQAPLDEGERLLTVLRLVDGLDVLTAAPIVLTGVEQAYVAGFLEAFVGLGALALTGKARADAKQLTR